MSFCWTDSAFAQRQNCVCRTEGSDKTFQLPPTADCRSDCKSKGAVNVQSCQLLTKTTQGDCKGHISCVCGVNLVLLGEGVNARFIMKNNYKEQTVTVGEIVRFIVQGLPSLMGGIEEGTEHRVSTSCVIKYGDGETETEQCQPGNFGHPPPTHKYAKPGVYLATLEMNSTFDRSGASYSCEFTCSSGIVEAPITVVAKKDAQQK